ncbi:hypothetical protein Q9Q95_07590 [Sphingomonas sp. DG1-23]|uniref:hypothetical protein n=1 Tax=Sphingomonas sp. DG1-23 TaxID=3068316 RepID=UPI00273DEA29|nr:hypothetical protein [Sphingomonas sp. DG1-23]MDP5278781.1 hypothetical protein [Sphingomonas sp. DG1-23]
MYRPLVHAATPIFHHVVALGFVKGMESLSHAFFLRFGADIRTWPVIVLGALAILLYLAGLATARTVDRRWIRKTVPPADDAPPRTMPVAPLAAPAPATGETLPAAAPDPTKARRYFKYALVACVVVAVVAADRFGVVSNLRR